VVVVVVIVVALAVVVAWISSPILMGLGRSTGQHPFPNDVYSLRWNRPISRGM
jgi:hypothetical protein